MARHHAGWWAERITELAKGDNIAVIARRHGVSVRLIRWWKWKLGSGSLASMAKSAKSAPKSETQRQRLLPVVIAPSAVASLPVTDRRDVDAETIIETSRGRITMRGSLSAEQLAAVVAELVRG